MLARILHYPALIEGPDPKKFCEGEFWDGDAFDAWWGSFSKQAAYRILAKRELAHAGFEQGFVARGPVHAKTINQYVREALEGKWTAEQLPFPEETE